MCFAILCLFLDIRAYNHGLKGHPKPKTYCDNRGRVNREVQTVNWEAGKEGAAETGVKSGLKKAHKPWIRRKKGAQTVN